MDSAAGNVRYEILSCTVVAAPATCENLTLTTIAGTDNIRIGGRGNLVPATGDIKLELVMTGLSGAVIASVLTELSGDALGSVGFDFASDPVTRINIIAGGIGYVVTGGMGTTAALGGSAPVVSIFMDLAGLSGTISSVVFGPGPAAVPAPAGVALFGLALAGLATVARRRTAG